MKWYYLLCAFLFGTFLISCNKDNKQSETPVSDMAMVAVEQGSPPSSDKKAEQQIPAGVPQSDPDSRISPLPVKSITNPDWEKKIIKTATLRAEVTDFKNYTEKVHQTIKQYDGYIAQEDQNLSEEKSETVMSIKVPVTQFETLLNQLHGKDIKITERKIMTEDVTGQLVDTRARMEARKQMRLKYLEFLNRSKNMAEVLQVQNEINSIQEEIESAAGRVELLSHQSAYSTINLTFFQPPAGYRPVDETPGFFARASHAFATGAGWISELFVGLISVWPLILIISGIYFSWKKMHPAKRVSPNP